jgi:predicted MFS family arabinose efflux permease
MRASNEQRPTFAGKPQGGDGPPAPSRESLRGLDWFVFFVADVQTGFGPFVAVYLTTQKWTQVDIGLVLSISGLVALIGQVPGGALVDAAKSERFVAGLAIAAIAIAALVYAAFPVFPAVLAAATLHAAASCVLGPALAAISLGLVGHAAIAERLGRNARFASIGNGLTAALMGACGHFFSARAVFIITAMILVPALLALRKISAGEIDAERAHGGRPERVVGKPHAHVHLHVHVPAVLHKRPLLIFAGCVLLFHLANAAMLPLMGSALTMRSAEWATVLIAACIVVPQLVVAAISPRVGRHAAQWGRRRLLLIGFAALPIRAVLFATVSDPRAIVLVQVLDGVTAAVLGVMVPLIIADVTRGTGRFNLAQGVVGTTTGIGAAASTSIGGYLTDHFGSEVAFLGLGAVAVVALMAVFAFMPETRPADAEIARRPGSHATR